MSEMAGMLGAINRLRKEQQWMAECGGSLQGYIDKYGSKDDPDHSGNGGEAIYAADLEAVQKYEEEAVAAIVANSKKSR